MDFVERVLKERYVELKSAVGRTSVLLHEFGKDIKERYKIGGLMQGTVRSENAQFHVCKHRGFDLKRAVKTYYVADGSEVNGVVGFASHPNQDFELILNEIRVLCELGHPNLVRLFEVYFDRKYVHLVMDLCKGGELFDLLAIDRVEIPDALNIFLQIIEGIKYIHSKGYAHRGLCIENILFSDFEKKRVKIISFSGASKFHNGFKMKYGSPMYMAPEVFTENYNESCDIWAAGVILFTILIGHQPFQGRIFTEIMNKVQSISIIKSQNWRNLDKDMKKFIKKILVKKKRPNAEEIFKFSVIKKFLSQTNRLAIKRLMKTVKSIRVDSVFTVKVKLSNKLKIAAYKILAPMGVLSDLFALEGLWKEFDVNETDVLMESDIVNNIERILNKPELNERAQHILKKFDLDKRGCVSKEEFVGLLCNISEKALIKQAFQVLDADSDGMITAKDFDEYFKVDDYENLNKLMVEALENEEINYDTFSVLITKFVIN